MSRGVFSLPNSSNTTAWQVQHRLERFELHLASTGEGQGASLIGVNDAAGHFVGNTLEDVLAEIATGVAETDIIAAGATPLTIASGVIAVTQTYHSIETEGGDGTDNLCTINGLTNGQFYVFKLVNSSHNVVFRHNITNIYCPSGRDITLDTTNDKIFGFSDGTSFFVLDMSLATPAGGGLPSALASTDTDQGASLIGVEDADGNFTATDVEGVLAELYVTRSSTTEVVIWAPFLDPLPTGALRTWAEAVDAVNASIAPTTEIQIEADPWYDEVIIPTGLWQLNNTTIVGKVAYAQGGRSWISSQDFGTQGLNEGWQSYSNQFRGHQVLLWVHPEPDCQIRGCVGLKDMFFRGDGTDEISGSGGTFTSYDGDAETSVFTRSGGDDAFVSYLDLWATLEVNTNADGWIDVQIIEVIDANTVRVDVSGTITKDYTADVANGSLEWDVADRFDATFYMWGRLGGKESYISAYDGMAGTSILVRGVDHSGPSSSDNVFTREMVGMTLHVTNTGGGDGGDHAADGDYTIVSFIDANTVTIDLNTDLTGTDGVGVSEIHWTTTDHTDAFLMDNVDFRSSYGNYGSMYIFRGNLYMNIKGGTSIRAEDSIVCDGFMVIQSDGSPCWLGEYSIGGDGYLKIYALPGMNMNTTWNNGGSDISFDLYQGNTPYLPDNTGDWNSTPANIRDALDQLAARLRAIEP